MLLGGTRTNSHWGASVQVSGVRQGLHIQAPRDNAPAVSHWRETVPLQHMLTLVCAEEQPEPAFAHTSEQHGLKAARLGHTSVVTSSFLFGTFLGIKLAFKCLFLVCTLHFSYNGPITKYSAVMDV